MGSKIPGIPWDLQLWARVGDDFVLLSFPISFAPWVLSKRSVLILLDDSKIKTMIQNV